MRIKIVNPIVLTGTDWLSKMEEGYRDAHDPDTELDYVFLKQGIGSPEQHFWEDIQMTYVIQEIENTDQMRYDGLIVFCAADPGVAAAREWLDIPVVGAMETSVVLACLVGRSFTWLAPLSRGRGYMMDKIRLTGLEDRMASIRAIEVPVAEFENDKALLDKTIDEGRKAIEEDGADSLIIGCTGLVGLASGAQEALGIPVIDAGVAAIRMCETLVKMDLAQSKRAFPTPRSEMARRL